MSKVYFLGCGPGDPDLITVKAKKLIQKADVVVYSGSLIPPEILKMCKKARRYDAAKLVREEIFDLLKKMPKKVKEWYDFMMATHQFTEQYVNRWTICIKKKLIL